MLWPACPETPVAVRQSAAIAALSILQLLSVATTFGAGEPSFNLAVLRRDGVLVPFAAHHKGRWTASWPTPGRSFVIPVALDDVPAEWWGKAPRASTWTLYPQEGAAKSVRATAPTRYPAQCVAGFGFKTDYKSPADLPPPFERPYPKVGLAASGPVTIGRVEILDEKAPEWSDFQRRVGTTFAEAERRAIASYPDWRHPASPEERMKTPVTIERLYRAPFKEVGEVYYVELSRTVDDPRQSDRCGVVTFASGWIRPWRPEKKMFDLSAVITYCDRADASYVFPLGVVRMASRPPVWVLQVAGWDFERYVAIEIGREVNDLLVDAFGGDCPREPKR
jgi:hypothetical protein